MRERQFILWKKDTTDSSYFTARIILILFYEPNRQTSSTHNTLWSFQFYVEYFTISIYLCIYMSWIAFSCYTQKTKEYRAIHTYFRTSSSSLAAIKILECEKCTKKITKALKAEWKTIYFSCTPRWWRTQRSDWF